MSDYDVYDSDGNYVGSVHSYDCDADIHREKHSWFWCTVGSIFLWIPVIVIEYFVIGDYMDAHWSYDKYSIHGLAVLFVLFIAVNLWSVIRYRRRRKKTNDI